MYVTDIPSAEILPFKRAKKRVDVGSTIPFWFPAPGGHCRPCSPIGFQIGDRLFLSAWYSKEVLG